MESLEGRRMLSATTIVDGDGSGGTDAQYVSVQPAVTGAQAGFPCIDVVLPMKTGTVKFFNESKEFAGDGNDDAVARESRTIGAGVVAEIVEGKDSGSFPKEWTLPARDRVSEIPPRDVDKPLLEPIVIELTLNSKTVDVTGEIFLPEGRAVGGPVRDVLIRVNGSDV